MKNEKGKPSKVQRSTVTPKRTPLPKDVKPVGSSKMPVDYNQPKGKPFPKHIQPSVPKKKSKKKT